MAGSASSLPRPRNVAIAGKDLAIAWADGHESYLPLDALRRECPCATCRGQVEKEAAEGPLRILRPGRPGHHEIARIVPVGSYGLQIVWADGHEAGIYTYELLRRACPCGVCSPGR